MKILFLVNNVPQYVSVFNELMAILESEGHEIIACCDSVYSSRLYGLEGGPRKYFVFSEYFREGSGSSVKIDGAHEVELIRQDLFSDYDRAYTLGYPELYAGDYVDRVLLSLHRYFNHVLLSEKIDAVVYEPVTNGFAAICWRQCQRLGVKYLGIGSSRLPGHFAIFDAPQNEGIKTDAIFKKALAGGLEFSIDEISWAENYLKNLDSVQPDYMKFNGLNSMSLTTRYFKAEKYKKVLRLMREMGAGSSKNAQYQFQTGGHVRLAWLSLMRNIKRYLKAKLIARLYAPSRVGTDRYFLYPLHFHPEASTSILSFQYINEFEVIRSIAFSLPFGTKLYVKDHSSAAAYPTLDFYGMLSKLPNVVLIHPGENTKALVRGAVAVVTLTSTVGYEALLLGKRVFLLGHVFYENHPNVVRVSNLESLHRLIKENCSELSADTADINIKYVAAYRRACISGTFRTSGTREEIRATSERIAKALTIELSA